MEIERKFTVKEIPDPLSQFNLKQIEQAYLCTEPVLRIRRQDDEYFLTYKAKGHLAREEYNLPLTEDSYEHLKTKADGNIITKKRYLIPYNKYFTIELDIFEGKFTGLILAEVEFENLEQADSFTPPNWFDEEVTYQEEYHNSYLSKVNI